MSKQQQNIPALRFPDFQGTWKKGKIQDFDVQIIDGDRGVNYPKFTDFFEQGYCLFLNAKNVTKEGFKFDETAFISQEKDDAMSKGKLVRGDVVLTTRGSLGHMAIYDANIPFKDIRINSGMVIIRCKEKIDSSYAYSFFRGERFQREIGRLSFGSAQPQLTVSGIKSLPFSSPLKPEQQKIAAFLGAVDEKIASLQKKKDLLVEYKKGCMQKLFSQQIRFTDDNGKSFPDWEKTTLGKLCNITKGKQLNRDDMIGNGKIPVINGGITASGYTDKANEKAQTITISEGGNSCGYVDWQENAFWLGGHCYALHPKEKYPIILRYLFHALKASQKNIMAMRVGSGLPNIQKRDLEKHLLNIPHPDEQQKISKFLSVIDDKIDLVSEELDKAKTFKKGLLQQMFV